MPWQNYATIAVTLVAPLVAYLIAARKASGRIATTEAADLWRESTALRLEYKAQIDRLEEVIDSLRLRITQLEADNQALHRENIALTRKVEEVSNGHE